MNCYKKCAIRNTALKLIIMVIATSLFYLPCNLLHGMESDEHTITLQSTIKSDIYVSFKDKTTNELLSKTTLANEEIRQIALPLYSEIEFTVSYVEDLQPLYFKTVTACELFKITKIDIAISDAQMSYDSHAIDKLIERVKTEYDLFRADSCKAWISKEKRVEHPTADEEIACTIAGPKPLFLGKDRTLDTIDPLLQLIIFCPDSPIGYFITESYFEHTKSAYVYKKSYEKEAYLLAKNALQSQAHIPTGRNYYVTGYLLGYPEPSIKYYWIVNDFINTQQGILSQSVRVNNFPDWPKDLRKKFEQFENKPEIIEKVEADKISAMNWLQQHSQATVEQLKQDVANLEEIIRKNREISRSQSTIS